MTDITDYRPIPPVVFTNDDDETVEVIVIDAHRSEGRVARFDYFDRDGLRRGERHVASPLAGHMGWSVANAENVLDALHAAAVAIREASQ